MINISFINIIRFIYNINKQLKILISIYYQFIGIRKLLSEKIMIQYVSATYEDQKGIILNDNKHIFLTLLLDTIGSLNDSYKKSNWMIKKH